MSLTTVDTGEQARRSAEVARAWQLGSCIAATCLQHGIAPTRVVFYDAYGVVKLTVADLATLAHATKARLRALPPTTSGPAQIWIEIDHVHYVHMDRRPR
mgnify:CR=1 FL=1